MTKRIMRTPMVLALAAFSLIQTKGEEKQEEKTKEPKPPAGVADVLRHVPKKFATHRGWDAQTREMTLLIEGEKEEKTWQLPPDSEVKIDGWWGRAEQLKEGERLWVWFAIDRKKKPRALLMVADAESEKDIHATLADEPDAEFEKLRAAQREWLRGRWRELGLPASVSFLHPLGGEMEIMLDHEAMRWGRYLKNGDKVEIHAEGTTSKARVMRVEPWRERTRLLLATNSGLDQLDLSPGQRIGLTVPEPPADVQASDLPTDIGRLTQRQRRIDWFLSTIYCSCAIKGDKCTGMFYTQASCNLTGCGMPKEITRLVGALIDEGKSDEEIFLKYKEERGTDWWRPHLLK